jgi:AcrR family transcriptional regulator
MPPQVQFSRKNILDAAFGIFRTEGMEGLTARNVARCIGSSVGPLYSYFDNIQELQEEVMKMTLDLIQDYSKREYTDIPFLNMGVGFVCFARDEPVLFNSCCFHPETGDHLGNDVGNHIKRMREDPMLTEFNNEELSSIYMKMSFLAYGMAVLASQGNMDNDDTDNIIRILKETGADIIFMTRARSTLADPDHDDKDLFELWGYLIEGRE